MTADLALLIAQTGIVACLAVWMLSGVLDNWLHPALNEEAVAMVLRFDVLAAQFPAEFDAVRYRRISDRRVIRAAFYGIVAWETVAAVLLCIGTGLLAGALFGLGSADAARGWAMLGCVAFVITWSGFLIGGNWFCYWYGHFPAQATHFFLALWGTLAMILLGL